MSRKSVGTIQKRFSGFNMIDQACNLEITKIKENKANKTFYNNNLQHSCEVVKEQSQQEDIIQGSVGKRRDISYFRAESNENE